MPHDADATTPRLVKDHRRPRFCYQEIEAVQALHDYYSGDRATRRTTALAVYQTLTFVANEQGGAAARNGFQATRKDLAKLVGVSTDTLDRYLGELVECGLLDVERNEVEGAKVKLPNTYVLLPPPSRTGAATPGAGAATPSRTDAAYTRARSLPGKNQERKEPGATPQDAAAPPLLKVGGQNLGYNALLSVCGIASNSNRRTDVAAALNGSKKKGPLAGIRQLAFEEIAAHYGWTPEQALAEVAKRPEDFERALASMIERRAEQYRRALDGAILTPLALAKWWADLEAQPRRGSLTGADVLAHVRGRA